MKFNEQFLINLTNAIIAVAKIIAEKASIICDYKNKKVYFQFPLIIFDIYQAVRLNFERKEAINEESGY